MIRAWFRDTSAEDQRKPHMTDPPQMLDAEGVKKNTGILCWKIEDVDDYLNNSMLNSMKKERGYTYEDEMTISEQMPDYEKKIKIVFEEHLHADQEIRLILEGRGYFDLRDHSDRWIRMEVVKGDLISVPAGLYHRFTTAEDGYIRTKRYFVGKTMWTAYNRADPATDRLPARQGYLKSIQG